MEVRFILKDNVTESQQQMIESLNNLCFGIEEAILLNQDEGHLFGAVEIGACVAFEEERVVGSAYVYKRLTDYDGEDFYIGGIGGLAIAPEYRGKGYARKLVEVGLQKSYEIGVDVACLFTERTETVHKEVSTNNCCKFMAIFIVFPGFCLKQLQQLFSDNS